MNDLTPAMIDVVKNIGNRTVSATDMGVGGVTMARLFDLGLLEVAIPKEGVFPPLYRLTPRGEGAAAVLNETLSVPVGHEAPIARIKRLVASHYQIPAVEMISERRSRSVARPRQVAMYLAKKLTPKSYPHIGRQFGNRDHTTVLHAVRQVERLLAEDQNIKDDVTTLIAELGSASPVEKSAFFVADGKTCGA